MRIEHVAMWTQNIEIMKTFYIDYFGGIAGDKYNNPRKSFESYFITFDSGARLELMQMPAVLLASGDTNHQYIGLAHIAISVGSIEKVKGLTDELMKAGYTVISEPRYTGDGYYESCVLDPDGNRLELTV
ncbi:VOC family protein [Anoxynatronum buryatiense]|uniref:Lactoylglutathione lyase n=1 Tax=Anoxynatronum buryatiense TaxID=489973 RepID=A0AA45WXJ4_9CLOT|nr:VOC family protein [Anoxynatronum buryatiense]SMP59818.1 lactoylglutathione lyase [Anoxynatronum buryatiense]